jgi:arabinose-5-phosphate isomerase
MPVTEAMRFKVSGSEANLPLIPVAATLEQAYTMVKSTDKTIRRAGALLIVDEAGKLAGIFTDGDLRRHIFEDRDAVLSKPIGELMTKNPRFLPDTALVRDAVQLVRELRIDEVPVVDADGRPVGLIDVQDLVALKVIEG